MIGEGRELSGGGRPPTHEAVPNDLDNGSEVTRWLQHL